MTTHNKGHYAIAPRNMTGEEDKRRGRLELARRARRKEAKEKLLEEDEPGPIRTRWTGGRVPPHGPRSKPSMPTFNLPPDGDDE